MSVIKRLSGRCKINLLLKSKPFVSLELWKNVNIFNYKNIYHRKKIIKKIIARTVQMEEKIQNLKGCEVYQ